jgi:hypothetical protein
LVRVAVLCGALCAGAAGVSAEGLAYRLFLRDGTAIATYGEFARVGERVVFTISVGGEAEPERLQVVSLAASAIDWAKTDEYTLAVRAAHYAATRGEADYAALSLMVARALNELAVTPEVQDRVRLVERLRTLVADWSREHYAYRASEVRQMQSLLDEVMSEQRAAAGLTQFDLNLVANLEPPDVPLLPPPTPAEAIAQVLRVAREADVPADRSALLRSALRLIDRSSAGLPEAWATRTREETARAIVDEAEVDAAYHELRQRALARAQAAAARADAAGVARVLTVIRERDRRLGGRRPEDIAALMAAVQRWQDAAARLRLARDRWRMEWPGLREYQQLVRAPTGEVAGQRRRLEAIRHLTGPDPAALGDLRRHLARASDLVGRVTPPTGLESAHATLSSACRLALLAAETRERAVLTGDLQLAWDASSAAAGAIMLLAQARGHLEAALRPPALK